MTDRHVTVFGGSISSATGTASSTRASSRFAQRRPPGLKLKETRKPTADPEEGVLPPDCGLCQKTIASNPLLCEKCQIWNELNHVFQCLREEQKWWQLPQTTVADALENTQCMMCQQIANAVLTRFPVDDETPKKELLKAEVQNLGPYCLGDKALNSLDPAFLEKLGMTSIKPDDLRLPEPKNGSQTTEMSSGKRVRVVLYLIVTAPAGSTLRQTIPELDAYADANCDADPTESLRLLGCHRITQEGGPGLRQPTIGLQLELNYSQAHNELTSLKCWEDPYINIDLVSKWMKNCHDKHGSKCDPKHSHISVPPGFRAIDTQMMCIVELPSEPVPSYAALSYTWGATSGIKELQLEIENLSTLQKESSLAKSDGIPAVILDSITLCRSLKERYLWVDRLCIIQDDPVSKYAQIRAMDQIYHMAAFTIVAATPLGVGLPGVKDRPRMSSLRNHTRRFHPKLRFITDNFKHTVMGSFWSTRGWTYQEQILSRRAIYITEFQAYFLCSGGAEQEGIGEFAATVNPWDFGQLAQYLSTVADYMSRNLTFRSDILHAFTGIGNVFAKNLGTALINGLPELFLPQALLWETGGESIRRRETPEIPSWSWAAWLGPIKYDQNSYANKIGTLIEFYFQCPQGGLRRVKTNCVWFFQAIRLDKFQDLPIVNEMYPEMRFMPSSELSNRMWRECPHRPWNVSAHPPDLGTVKRASQYPGSLVFATTIASVKLRTQELGGDSLGLDILDPHNSVIGRLGGLHKQYVSEILANNSVNEIIVLAAGIRGESFRYALAHNTERTDMSLWLLHVMLIRRDEVGVARRLGIGTVEAQSWKRCCPKWCTIILL